MNLLFDSHAVLWWTTLDERIPARVRSALDAGAMGTVSAVSIWELEIKKALGKLAIEADLSERIVASGFRPLPITFEHGVAAANLPLHHRDPFDRMLVAQARLEGLTLVTGDARLRRYDVAVLWD